MDAPGVCKHFNLDPTKVCVPVMMAAGEAKEGNCCYNHTAGCALHAPVMIAGKPFVLDHHRKELNSLGLTGYKKELADMVKAGKKPSGTPRKIGNTLVYPVPHFG